MENLDCYLPHLNEMIESEYKMFEHIALRSLINAVKELRSDTCPAATITRAEIEAAALEAYRQDDLVEVKDRIDGALWLANRLGVTVLP